MANTNQRFNRNEINDELQLNGVVTRDISPPPNLMTILESSGYKVSEALSDITDNSVDADATKIITYFGNENKKPYIVIGDNGTGMEPDTLFGALVIGASDPELGNKVKNGGSLGKYGTGLKSSILSLKGIAIILTKTIDGQLLKTIYHQDTIQEYYAKHNAWGITIELSTDKEDVELFDQYTDNSKHGTVIKIYNIERYTDTQYYKNKMMKTYSRYFHRFITSGVEFVVNNKIVVPVDLCGYEIPFTMNGETHKSTLMGTEVIWDNITYTDKHGVKHKDGYLRYRAFLLPQQNIVDESAWIEEFDWNMTNQGICIYRGNRLIQSRGWLGKSTNPRLNRFRVELDFNGDLDVWMNVDFKKTSVDPDGSILKLIDSNIRRDIGQATDIFNASSGQKNKVSQSLKKLAKRFSTWAKNNANLLPKIPKTNTKIKSRKPRTTSHPVSGKKMKVIGDRLRFIYDDQNFENSFYKTETSGRYNNCLDIYWNVNHVMFEFVEQADTDTLAPVVCLIWGEHFGKESNKPESSTKALEEYNTLWDNIQISKGGWLTKMYPTAPKV